MTVSSPHTRIRQFWIPSGRKARTGIIFCRFWALRNPSAAISWEKEAGTEVGIQPELEQKTGSSCELGNKDDCSVDAASAAASSEHFLIRGAKTTTVGSSLLLIGQSEIRWHSTLWPAEGEATCIKCHFSLQQEALSHGGAAWEQKAARLHLFIF